MKSLTLTVLLSLFFVVSARVFIQVDSKIENCVDENEKWGAIDFTQLELVPENDTHTFINGTNRALKDMKSPLHLVITAEFYTRGEWVMRAYNRTYPNFCTAMKNPVEPWFYVTKYWPPCPYKAGTEWNYDMVAVEFPEKLLNTIPSDYMGRWRLIFQYIVQDKNGIQKRDCWRFYSTIFDD